MCEPPNPDKKDDMIKKEEELKKCFSELKKATRLKSRLDTKFDELCSKYFGIEDFGSIYQDNDNIVEVLEYGNGSMSWNEFVKAVEKYKKEKMV